MAHLHSIYDSDTHFKIDAITREIKNEGSTKTTIMQYDHNSERFTFELPRYIEGHDMSLCNAVKVHYRNIDLKTKTITGGTYDVTDFQVSPESDDVAICSWLISQNATQHNGSLLFRLSFRCVNNGIIEYAWNTDINSEMTVGEGYSDEQEILKLYPDVVEQLKSEFEASLQKLDEDLAIVKSAAENFDSVKSDIAQNTESVKKLEANKADKTLIDKVVTEVQPCKPIADDINTTLNNMSIEYDSKTCMFTLNTNGEALSANAYLTLDLSLFESGKKYCFCKELVDGEIGGIYVRRKIDKTDTPYLIGNKGTTLLIDDTVTQLRLQFQSGSNFTCSIRIYAVEGAYQEYREPFYQIKDDVEFPRLEQEFDNFKNNDFANVKSSAEFATQKSYFNPFSNGFLRISYNGTKFAPPNTTIGVKTSSFLGYRAIKGDVRKCADGYVMCHDTTIQQTTTGSGTIINMTVEQIKSYPLKSQINGFSENIYIDTFEDWLLACKCNNITPFINFKDDLTTEEFSSEAEDCLAIIERLGMIDKCVIQAFTFENLEKIRSLNDKVMMMKVLYQGNIFVTTGAAQLPQRINRIKPCGVILFDNNSNGSLLRGDDTVGGMDDTKNHATTHYFDDFNLINDETLSYCRENNIPIEVAICYSFAMDKVVQNAGFDGVMTNASYDLPRSKKVINVNVDNSGDIVTFSTLDGEITSILNDDGSYQLSVDSITPNMIYYFKPKVESDVCSVTVNNGCFVISNITGSGIIRIEI